MQTFCGLTTDGMFEYLAAIYKQSQQGTKITTGRLADVMHVTSAAVSSMLKRLDRLGFIQRSSGTGILLTEQGKLAALQMIRRHRLLEVFLIQVMGFTWDQVDTEAHRLEHAISAEFEDRMDHLCDFPTHCPHGDPIPRKDGTIPNEQLLLSIPELEIGQQGVLRRVGMKDARVLRYLSQCQLMPGTRVKLVDQAPFNGPVTLDLIQDYYKNKTSNPDTEASESITQILGHELAAELFIAPL